MIVSDASPLIHLARLTKIRAATEKFGPLVLPPTVHEESVEQGVREGYADAALLADLERRNLLRVELVPERWSGLVSRLKEAIGAGEAEAIALAAAKNASLLMDDAAGRRTATYEHVDTLTTLALLLRLSTDRVLGRQEVLNNMRRYGADAWIAPEVLARFLAEVRE